MTYPVVMLVREVDAPRITRVWNILAEGGYSTDQVRFGYPPHVTVALVTDKAKPEVLIERLKETVANWKPLPVTFDGIAILPRDVAPLLARPNVSSSLLAANNEICRRVSPDLLMIVPYSMPGVWQPHTTLSRDIPPNIRGEALEAVLKEWKPFETTLDRVALLHTDQDAQKNWCVKELWRCNL
jgi:2'-5' RNA ligase